MAHAISISSGIAGKRIGLEIWMDRVLEQAKLVEEGWDAEAVHDLRVALRRCRTMAQALSGVNPRSGWRKLKRTSRELFRTLGELRDTQVEREWVRKLGSAGDPVRRHMLRILSRQEKMRREGTARALDKFERKNWRKLRRKLSPRVQLFPPESVVFQGLAVTQLNHLVELDQRARKGRSRIAWHRLRIGLKRFRYIVENFLPQRYEAWGESLKRMQDLLGEVHDLDVLRIEIRRHCAGMDPRVVARWLEKVEVERKIRLEEFRSIVSDKESLWLAWRARLQGANRLSSVPLIEAQNAHFAS
jgi:CHAD domain-containing protein